MNEIAILLVGGFSVWYITECLLYSDGPQPLSSRTRKVVLYGKVNTETNTVEEISHAVGFFDYIRFIYGLYIRSDKDTWTVNKDRLYVWVCHKCLCVWVSLHIIIFLILITGNILYLSYLFAFAGLSYAVSLLTSNA